MRLGARVAQDAHRLGRAGPALADHRDRRLVGRLMLIEAVGGQELAVSGDADPGEARVQLLRGIEQLTQVFRDSESLAALHRATDAVKDEQFYQGLRALRSLLPREERLLALVQS